LSSQKFKSLTNPDIGEKSRNREKIGNREKSRIEENRDLRFCDSRDSLVVAMIGRMFLIQCRFTPSIQFCLLHSLRYTAATLPSPPTSHISASTSSEAVVVCPRAAFHVHVLCEKSCRRTCTWARQTGPQRPSTAAYGWRQFGYWRVHVVRRLGTQQNCVPRVRTAESPSQNLGRRCCVARLVVAKMSDVCVHWPLS